MKKITSLGVCLIIGIELLALTQHDRRWVLAASGAGLALVLLTLRRALARGFDADAEPAAGTHRLGQARTERHDASSFCTRDGQAGPP